MYVCVVGFLRSLVAAGCSDGDGAQTPADAARGRDAGRGRALARAACAGLLAAGLLGVFRQVDRDLALQDPAEVVECGV